jgi:hypothetical protein
MLECVRVDWPSPAYSCNARGSKGGSGQSCKGRPGFPRRLVYGSEVTGNGRRAAGSDACRLSAFSASNAWCLYGPGYGRCVD